MVRLKSSTLVNARLCVTHKHWTIWGKRAELRCSTPRTSWVPSVKRLSILSEVTSHSQTLSSPLPCGYPFVGERSKGSQPQPHKQTICLTDLFLLDRPQIACVKTQSEGPAPEAPTGPKAPQETECCDAARPISKGGYSR